MNDIRDMCEKSDDSCTSVLCVCLCMPAQKKNYCCQYNPVHLKKKLSSYHANTMRDEIIDFPHRHSFMSFTLRTHVHAHTHTSIQHTQCSRMQKIPYKKWWKKREKKRVREESLVPCLPGSGCHEILSAKDDQHVDAAIVKDIGPILHHPLSRVLMNKVILEVKNVCVIWYNFVMHFFFFFFPLRLSSL